MATLLTALWQALHHLAHMLLRVPSHLGEEIHGPICQLRCLYSFTQKEEICFTISVCILWSRFFFKEKERKKKGREKLWLELVEALFLCNFFYHPALKRGLHICWEESVLRCGFPGARGGGRTRMKCAGWVSSEEKSQWVRSKNSQNPGRETKTTICESPQAKGQELQGYRR